MPRYTVGALSAGAGSTTLPLFSVYAAAAIAGTLRECGVFNTTATGVAVKLARLSTTGTQGATVTAAKYNPDSAAAAMGGFNTHTVAPTATDLGYRAQLGAAVGSGVIWTFGDLGIRLTAAVTNGVGVLIENGTGQVCQVYFVWDE
jgi:hypothetical protein